MNPLKIVLALSLVAAGGESTEAIRKDRAALQGTWQVVASEQDGERVPAADIKDLALIFKDDAILVREGGKAEEKFAFKLDPTQKPKQIDLTIKFGPAKGRIDRAIYAIDGGDLRICIQSNKDALRPVEFSTQPGSKLWLVVLRRTKG